MGPEIWHFWWDPRYCWYTGGPEKQWPGTQVCLLGKARVCFSEGIWQSFSLSSRFNTFPKNWVHRVLPDKHCGVTWVYLGFSWAWKRSLVSLSACHWARFVCPATCSLAVRLMPFSFTGMHRQKLADQVNLGASPRRIIDFSFPSC